MKYVIAIAGGIGAGKSTATSYLMHTYGAKFHKFSSPFRAILDRLHIDNERENIVKLSVILRSAFGQDLLSKVVAKDMEHDESDLIVLDGARRPEDIEFLQKLPGFRLVYLEASLENRYERVEKRAENRDDKGKTLEEFKHDLAADTEALTPLLRPHAHVIWVNDGTTDELHALIDAFMAELGVAAK